MMLNTEQATTRSRCSIYSGNIPLSLLHLSEDLREMFEKHKICDITLSVGNKEIRSHRAILSARSNWFAYKVKHASPENDATIIMNESDKIMDALLVYIYTGNLKLIESLNIPLLDLRDAADRYGLDRFKKLLTRMIKFDKKPSVIKTLEFLWRVNINDCKTADCSCPLLEGFSLQGTDKWELKMKSTCLEQMRYVFGIYLKRETENSTTSKTHIASLEIHILDTAGQKRRTFITDHIFNRDGENKMSDYISLCRLMENAGSLLPDGLITLSGQLTISEEDPTSSSRIFKVSGSPHEKGVTNELHALSYDMYKMMKAGKFCDTSIYVKGSPLILVHSCIVYARSSIPIGALSALVDFGIFDNIVAKSFLSFVYTGQMRFLEEYMRIVYGAVCRLQLKEAKMKYSNILAISLSIDNVFGILSDAFKFDDKDLMFAALFFVARHTNDLVEHRTWSLFTCDHPTWAREIMQLARLKRSASLL